MLLGGHRPTVARMLKRSIAACASLLLCWACGSTTVDGDPEPAQSDAGASVGGKSAAASAGSAPTNGGADALAGASDGGASAEGGSAGEAFAGAAGDIESAGAAGGSEAGPVTCALPPLCDAAPPPVAKRPFRHSAPFGSANHRGRDSFFLSGEAQWVLGNFEYGVAALEAPLQDEEIDVYVLRDCGSTWAKLGTALTTRTVGHYAVEGVSDAKGRLYFEIPQAKRLGVGRHRLRLVVAGDSTSTDAFIEIVPADAKIVVSDMDGTLTTNENAQTLALFTGTLPEANVGAPQVLNALVAKGYRAFYLTARPEWLVGVSRDFIAQRGFPPGILHTTLGGLGATGPAAAEFKSAELARVRDKGLALAFAFGNTSTDADAYDAANVQPLERRIFFQYTDTAWHGRRIEAYGSLLPEISDLTAVCKQ